MPNRPRKRYSRGGVISGGVLAILASVLAVEGGWVDHRDDPGGETNLGITQATARECGWYGPMRDLTEEFALDCYHRLYIKKPGFTQIVEQSPALGKEVVDTGVNTGTGRAARWFQESLNHLNRKQQDYPDIAEDGVVGPESMLAWEALKAKRGLRRACEMVIKLVDAKQGEHYMKLMRGDHRITIDGERLTRRGSGNTKFESFGPGWTKRLQNVPLAECKQ